SGVTFSANGTHAAKSSTATFTHAGTYVFAVTIADEDGLTTTSQVTVVVQQQVSTITVTPSSTTVGLDGTVPFAASAIDQFGDAVPAPALSWSVSGGGSVDAAGKFQANGAIGSFTVTATAGAVHATATVTVEDMPPFIVSPPVASPNPAPRTTTTLHARLESARPGGEPRCDLAHGLHQPGGAAGIARRQHDEDHGGRRRPRGRGALRRGNVLRRPRQRAALQPPALEQERPVHDPREPQ